MFSISQSKEKSQRGIQSSNDLIDFKYGKWSILRIWVRKVVDFRYQESHTFVRRVMFTARFFSFFFIVGRVLFVSVTGTYKVKACRKLPEHKSHGFRSCPGAETMSEIRGRGLGNTKVERERENARSEY